MLSDPSGQPISLRDQSMSVLVHLAERPNCIVRKDEIIAEVWPDTFVTDDSLVQCIKEIRRAIGDHERKVVETLVKRGYRLNIDLKSGSNRPVDEIPRVVVLAFSDQSIGENKGVLNDAIADSLIAALAHFGEFSVVSRHSSFQIREANIGIAEIASKLAVQYVVEGSQQLIGEKLRVSINLIDAESQSSIWSHSYDLTWREDIDLHSDLVWMIAASVGYRVREHAPTLVKPEDQSAMHLFLSSGADVQMPSRAAIRLAIEVNKKAIESDPSSAYGYIGVSFAHLANYLDRWDAGDPNISVRLAAEFSDKALALSPRNSQAYYANGEANLAANNLAQAEQRLRRSLELNPYAPHVRASLACLLMFRGENSLALNEIDRAIGADPEHPDWFFALKSSILRQSEDFHGALETFQRMTTVPGSNHMNLAAIMVGLGRQEDAELSIGKFLKKVPHHTISRERAAVKGKFVQKENMDAWLALIRKAGLPE